MAILGFASGLPFTLATKTSSAILAERKVDAPTIGMVGGAIGLVYAWKFLWSPVVDARPAPLFAQLGRRRSWLVITQVPLIAAIAALGFVAPAAGESLSAFVAVLLIVAFFSATQDILINGWTVDAFPNRRLGLGSALSVGGYRLAMLIAGWAVLALGGWQGWPLAFTAMAAMLALGLIATLASREPTADSPVSLTYGEAIASPIVDLVRSLRAWALPVLAFALIYKLPDQLGNAMQEPLLITKLGYELGQFGFARNAIGLPATIVGSFVGAWLVARFGLIRALAVAGVLQAVSNLGFAWLHATSDPLGGVIQPWLSRPMIALAAVSSIESLCGGLTGTVFVAWLMSLCNRRFGASQYALLSGIVQLSASIAGAVGGALAKEWTSYYVWSAIVGIPGVAMVALLSWRRQPER
jgi:MFS transporter, PAT family, beta-lactamase induction signal transducer AmpG